MYTPTLALLWQTWGRHRWGLAATVAGLYGLIALHRSLPTNAWMADSQAALYCLPIGGIFLYLFYAFSYAETGQRGKGSGFPHWMLTLPVRTWLLVAPPMLSGMATVALAWIVAGHYILKPMGLEVPLVGPGLGLAFTLACVQALEWSPLSTRVKLLIMAPVLGGVWYGLFREDWQTVMLGVMPVLLLLAFVGGVLSVGLTRQGGMVRGEPATTDEPVARRRELAPFASAARAQLWMECRRNGLIIPGAIACWLALLTLMLVLAGPESLLGLLEMNVFLVPYMCIFLGCLAGKTDVWDRSLRITSYAAGRPLNSGTMVTAKLQMTGVALLVSAALFGIFVSGWFLWMRDTHAMEQFWRRLVGSAADGSWIFIPIILAGIVGVAWLQLAGHLFAGLAGRVWVFAGVIVSYLVVIPNLLAFNSGWQQEHREAAQHLSDMLPWIFGGLVVLKLVAAGAVFRLTVRRGLWNWRVVRNLVAIWTLIVLCLLSVSFEAISEHHRYVEDISLSEFVMAGSLMLFLCPLTRIGLAPLALEWNRRR